jgi:hypothetical protein
MTNSTNDDSDRDPEDDGDWGEPIFAPAPRGRLAAVVSVRFTPEEVDLLRSAAKGGTLSHFIRASAVSAARSHCLAFTPMQVLLDNQLRNGAFDASTTLTPAVDATTLVVLNS